MRGESPKKGNGLSAPQWKEGESIGDDWEVLGPMSLSTLASQGVSSFVLT